MMLDLQMTIALQQSRRIITDLFEQENPHSSTLRTAGEPKFEPMRFKPFWQFPKLKRVKVQTRVPMR
jgi:hypothetical protein